MYNIVIHYFKGYIHIYYKYILYIVIKCYCSSIYSYYYEILTIFSYCTIYPCSLFYT